jgi:hypothetical protein
VFVASTVEIAEVNAAVVALVAAAVVVACVVSISDMAVAYLL